MESATQIRLSALACSFPLGELHPLYEKVVEEIATFYKGFADSASYSKKELELLASENWPFLACISWPTALDSRLPWITKFLAWFILLDNEADDTTALGADGRRTAAITRKYLELMTPDGTRDVDAVELHVEGATVRDCMLLSCFASLWQHFSSNMTPSQFARLSKRCCTTFTHIAQQSKLREEGSVLSPAQMLVLKREVSFNQVVIPLMEYGAAIELDERILARPEIREIEVACADHLVISNDILSFRREYNSQDFSNLPSAFWLSAADRQFDLQTAMDLTCELLCDADRKFHELYISISEATYFTPQVKAFIDGLGFMMSGTLEWNWRTPRHHGLHWVAPPPNEREGIMYLEDPPRFKSTITRPSTTLSPSYNLGVCAI